MKHQGPATPEERKTILKKIFYALRQSPMFSNYSLDRIRDSAIKSEQLTYDKSSSKQEYIQAMYSKLLKIEKSYVMNTEDILRELSQKNRQKTYASSAEEEGVFGSSALLEADEERYLKREEPECSAEFTPLRSLPGRGNSFSFMPSVPRPEIRHPPRRETLSNIRYGGGKDSRGYPVEDSVGGESLGIGKPGTPRILGSLDSFSMPLERFHKDSSASMRAPEEPHDERREAHKGGSFGHIGIPGSLGMQGFDGLGRIANIKTIRRDMAHGSADMGLDKLSSLPHVPLGGLHRVGAAGSTNTVTKLNSNRFFSQPEKVQKPTPSKQSIQAGLSVEESKEKKAHGSQGEKPSGPSLKKEESRVQTGVQDLVGKVQKEVQEMKTVVSMHKKLLPRWEAQRKIFTDLEEALGKHMEASSPGMLESLQGILQQMKKQVIVLTAEIKQCQKFVFRKQLSRISAAYMQKRKENSEYLFLSQ